MKTLIYSLSLVLIALVIPTGLYAQPAAKVDTQLKLAGIFGDHMVLQRNSDAPIWGVAKPKAKVTIEGSWSRKSVRTVADADGKWMAKIPTPEAGKNFTLTVESDGKKVKLKNVLSGEVWICSGQSNMQWKLRGFGLAHFKEDVDKAKYPEIRLCDVPQVIALEEQDDVKARWKVCSPQSVMSFSAVAYFFGSRLHQELDVPIGLISTNWGGSAIEGWISPEVLSKELPDYKEKTKNYSKWLADGGALYSRALKNQPKGLNQSSPSVLYNSMLKPIIPFSFRGVIWYQGESNVKRPLEYRKLFPAMIRDWRARWGQGDFPFYYVQIAPFAYKTDPYSAAFLREAQTMALSEPKTGMVVTMDIGDFTNIHPKKKKPVGERLALLALSRDYGKSDIIASGPHFSKSQVEGGKIRLKFAHADTGLVAKGGGDLTHFTIAGSDKKFVPAKAVIEGHSIIVSSDAVATPVAVRFAWGSGDEPNLANKAGLPASSFRTDDWPLSK